MLRNRKVVPYSQGSIVNGPEVHSFVSVREGFPCFMAMGSLTLRLMMWSSSIVACVQTLPLPQEKSGEETPLPIFPQGVGTSVHRLHQLWVDVMLCYVIICLEDLDLRCCYFWPRLSEISSSPRATTSKPKNVCHHCNIRYSWQWAQDDVARQAAKGYGLIGKAMKKIVVASIEASSQVRPCIDI